MVDKLLFKEIKNYKKVIKNIREDLAKYVTSNGIKSLVLGVSGGLDSAVVAAIARPVCDKLSIPLHGISLPTATNKQNEVHRANAIMKSFCNWYCTLDIEEISSTIWKRAEFGEKIGENRKPTAFGNIKARTRMIFLYNYAFMGKGMVLGTDNLTEYLLGFWTLHGDVGDYSPIQFLWKSEVYKLAAHIIEKDLVNVDDAKALQDCIYATPTDGLGITSSDIVSLAGDASVTYEQIDYTLQQILKKSGVVYPVLARRLSDRHNHTHFKRNNPYNISRKKLLGGR